MPLYPATGHFKGGVRLRTGRLTLLPDIALNSSVAPTQSFQSKPSAAHDTVEGTETRATSKMWTDKRTKMTSSTRQAAKFYRIASATINNSLTLLVNTHSLSSLVPHETNHCREDVPNGGKARPKAYTARVWGRIPVRSWWVTNLNYAL